MPDSRYTRRVVWLVFITLRRSALTFWHFSKSSSFIMDGRVKALHQFAILFPPRLARQGMGSTVGHEAPVERVLEHSVQGILRERTLEAAAVAADVEPVGHILIVVQASGVALKDFLHYRLQIGVWDSQHVLAPPVFAGTVGPRYLGE